MILDYLGGILCLAVCVFMASINILTSPKRRHWMDCPEWVRMPMFLGALCFIYRAGTLFQAAGSGNGHITLDGFVALVGLTASMGALTGYILSRTYPIMVWDRLKWIQDRVCCANDREVPVMMPRAKMFDLLRNGSDFVAMPSTAPGAMDDANVPVKTASIH